MIHALIFPDSGGTTDGVLVEWLKKESDSVKAGDVVARLQTADAILELKSQADGKLLKIVVPAGTVVRPGEPLCLVGDKSANLKDALKKVAQLQPSEPAPAPAVQLKEAEVPKPAAKPAVPVAQPAEAAKPSPAAAGEEVIPILMPQAGQSMEEGTLLSWKVKEGDRIEAGQIIFEIETDKATMEVEADQAGRLAKIVAAEGDIVEIKVAVGYMAENDADVEAFLAGQTSGASAGATATQASAGAAATVTAESTVAVQRTQTTKTDTGRVKASPAARRQAAQRGIDLATVTLGSGPGGRILSTDLAAAQVKTSGPIKHPLSKMRRAIAQNLLYSKQNVPHFYLKLSIEAAALFKIYRQTKESFKVSINDFITRACAKAIREFPAVRSQYKDTEIVELPNVNIGIAVGIEEGLTVPVVMNADRLSLQDLAAKSRQVVENARNGKLEGVGQGVFTITNLGMFGIEEFLPIINPPEAAILSVGAIREEVKVENGAMKPTQRMTLCLAADHRVVDGVLGAQFLNRLKELLEDPEELL